MFAQTVVRAKEKDFITSRSSERIGFDTFVAEVTHVNVLVFVHYSLPMLVEVPEPACSAESAHTSKTLHW
jgi:hypothetical protein